MRSNFYVKLFNSLDHIYLYASSNKIWILLIFVINIAATCFFLLQIIIRPSSTIRGRTSTSTQSTSTYTCTCLNILVLILVLGLKYLYLTFSRRLKLSFLHIERFRTVVPKYSHNRTKVFLFRNIFHLSEQNCSVFGKV